MLDLIALDLAVLLDPQDAAMDIREMREVEKVLHDPERRGLDRHDAAGDEPPVRLAEFGHVEQAAPGCAERRPDMAVTFDDRTLFVVGADMDRAVGRARDLDRLTEQAGRPRHVLDAPDRVPVVEHHRVVGSS